MLTTEQAALAYVAAWNEQDITKRRKLLETCWAEDGCVVSNHDAIIGRAMLLECITSWRDTYPNDRAVFTSGIEQHHCWFRFTVVVVRPDGSTYSEALDVGEVDSDGRIIKIITFFGPLPAAPVV